MSSVLVYYFEETANYREWLLDSRYTQVSSPYYAPSKDLSFLFQKFKTQIKPLCVICSLFFFATSSTQTAKLCWPVTSSLTHLKYYTVFILFFQVQFSKEQDSFQSQLQNQTLSCKSSVSHLVSVINKDVNLYRAGDFLALIWPGWSLAQVMRRAQVMRQRLPSTRLLSEETWRTLVECF